MPSGSQPPQSRPASDSAAPASLPTPITTASSPAPTSSPPTFDPLAPSAAFHGTPPALHYGALVVAILGPAALLLPPRRLSVQNAILSAGAWWGANLAVHDYTGKSLWVRSTERWANVGSWGGELPPAAERNRQLMKEARRQREELQQKQQQEVHARQGEAPVMQAVARMHEEAAGRPAAAAAADGVADRGKDGVLQRLWMGGEKEGWRAERLAKEKEALEEGKGYWDLIMDHMRDAWGSKESRVASTREEQAERSENEKTGREVGKNGR